MPKADYFKLFSADEGVKVALFTSDCGWIENVPAQAVFKGDVPAGLPHEEMLLIKDFPIEHFSAEFITAHTDLGTANPAEASNQSVLIGSLVISLARKLNIPQQDAGRFTVQLFKLMQRQLAAGRTLNSAFASIKPLSEDGTGWLLEFRDASR
jgi:hypothetical protein